MPLWSVICRFQKANTKAKCKCKGKCIGKCFWCPKCWHLYLECRFGSVIFRFQKGKCKGKCIGKWFLFHKCGIYLLNAALKRDLSQKANTKAKCKCKGKWKWFLCPKCGIYLLNAASKHDFSISECKYKGKMQMKSQMNRKMVFMP